MLKPAFIDISHHQVRSYEPAKAMGIIGVIHKATEGTTFADTMAPSRYEIAKAAHIDLWGLYHFIRPGKIIDQAHWFIKNSKYCADDNTLLALDYEDAGVSLDDALIFLQEVEQLTGREPVLYSGHVLKDKLAAGHDGDALMRFRLWLAHYTSAAEPTLPQGWLAWWGWQYSDKGEVQHIEPPTDLNAFDGTAAQLAAEWADAGRTPWAC